ncbi:HipA family kinase [Flavobacterium sp. J27]|uniref:HipA family kinase n=1 Tax=Flavobacterium sp. J27 TaxID=2060419 RepID=UPI001030849B|nr:HipA family kinase [Flavobacterium sp. J27]
MQELKINNFETVIKGGSSKPILINAFNHEGIEKAYVMKTYKSKFVKENFSIAKEILVTELAKEFDLPVPEYGIIKIDNKDLKGLYNDEEIKLLDKGYKFCTEYHEGYVIMSSLASSKFLKQFEVENLFAFDNLIMNVDRGGFRNKPNLLLNDDEIMLIDHEQTLAFINSFDNNNINFFNTFNNFYYKNHIFWANLKSIRNDKKEHLFEEFIEILRMFNIEKLNLIFEKMDFYGIEYGEKNIIFAYLYWAKQNCSHINKVLIDRLK